MSTWREMAEIMGEAVFILVLFAIGLLVLVVDIFVPSHALLTVVGLGILAYAVVRTFQHWGAYAGVSSIIACLIIWPIMAYIGVKNWHRTPAGRWLAPPNPVLTTQDIGVDVASLVPLIGAKGTAVTNLRPVGICCFGDQRVPCIAETGIIEADTPVVGLAVRGGQLVVGAVNPA